MSDPDSFVRAQTRILAPSLVPEIRLHLADRMTPIWRATQTELDGMGVPPPYWAFAWPGGQALARHLLDHPDIVASRRVLDFAAGSGLGAIAAARAGAAGIVANDTDPIAAAAIALNAALNQVKIEVERGDLVGAESIPFDVVLAGDVCYERPMAERAFAWFQALSRRGMLVLMGDPGRDYLPQSCLAELARYRVPTSTDLEDSEERQAIVWRVTG